MIWRSKIPNTVNRERQELSALVRRAAFEIEQHAKILAPVDTGFMRNSIQATFEDDLNATVSVGAEYGIYVELGTVRALAQPFLLPAAEHVVRRFGGQLRQVI